MKRGDFEIVLDRQPALHQLVPNVLSRHVAKISLSPSKVFGRVSRDYVSEHRYALNHLSGMKYVQFNYDVTTFLAHL